MRDELDPTIRAVREGQSLDRQDVVSEARHVATAGDLDRDGDGSASDPLDYQPLSPGDWSTFGHDPQHTFCSNYDGPVIQPQLLWECEQDEFELGAKRELKSCHYVGSYCASDVLGVCIERRKSYSCLRRRWPAS